MTKLFALEPETAGGWGPKTVVANRLELERGLTQVPHITHLEYVFDGWMGDELITSFPCYIVTEDLAKAIEQADLSGTQFDGVQVSTSEIWEQFDPDIELPAFRRLIPTGEAKLRKRNEIISWSGHDVCWGTRVDFKKPESPDLVLSTPPPNSLVVTERCLYLLQQHRMENCEIEELVWTSQ